MSWSVVKIGRIPISIKLPASVESLRCSPAPKHLQQQRKTFCSKKNRKLEIYLSETIRQNYWSDPIRSICYCIVLIKKSHIIVHVLMKLWRCITTCHYIDVIMSPMASQITRITIVCPTVGSDADEKKASKLHVTGLCKGNSPLTGEFPAQKASNAENVSIWWRYHVLLISSVILAGLVIARSNITLYRSKMWRINHHFPCLHSQKTPHPSRLQCSDHGRQCRAFVAHGI